MDPRTEEAVRWLLASAEPAVRYLARRDLLHQPADVDARHVLDVPMVTALLSGQRPDGGFGGHPYRKWTGAFWRLISLVELAVPPTDDRAVAAAHHVLDWLTGEDRRSVVVIDGLVRRCAAQEGFGLAACTRLGLADDPRVRRLAECLVDWQWPDGGWNCDRNASGRRSSFHESLAPMWGLHEYGRCVGEGATLDAAERAAELFLEHRLFRTLRTGEVIHRGWLTLHYPPYWHYDILQALLLLARVGKATDPRAAEALAVLERRRLPDGRWRPGAYWWTHPGRPSHQEIVDWGRSGPNEMITLNALRVLSAAGRLAPYGDHRAP